MDRKTLEQNYQKSFGASPAAELEQNYQRSGIDSLVQSVKKATQYNPSAPSTQPTQAAPAGASSRKQSDAMKEQLDTIKKQRDDAAIKAGAYMRAGNMPQQAKEQQEIANKAAIEYENAYTQWKNQRNAEAVEDYNPDENKFKAGDAALSGVQNAFQSMRQYAAAASSYLSGNPEAQAWEAKRLMESGVSGTEAVKRAGLADKREIPITDYKTQAELRHEKNVASVGAVEGGALQLVNTISNMVPSLVANAVLPGSGLPVMAASAAGNKYADAYEKYGNTDTAFVLGSAAGGASMLTEQFGGLYGSLGKSAAGQSVAKKLMAEAPGLYNLANSVGGKWLRDALSEGIEEGAEDVINYAIEKALTGDSDEMDNFGYDILLGALAGGVFGGGNAAMRSVTYSRVGKALNASPAAVAQQVQEGMEKGAGTAPAIYAAEVQKNPSNQMVGRLYEANLTYDAESGLSKIQNDITQVSINEIKAMVSKADALAQAAQKLNVEATPQAVATAITDAQRTQSIKTAEDSVWRAFAPTVDNPANAGEKAYNSALSGVAANQGVAARINNDPAARQAFSQLTGVQFSGNTAQDIAAIEVATQNIAKSGKQAISQAEYAQRVAAAGEQAAAQFDSDMQAQAEQMQRESDERWLSVEQNTITDVDGKRRIKEITNTDVRGNTEIGYKKAEIPGSKKKTVAEVNNAAKYLGKTIVWFEGAVQVNGQYRLTNGYRAPDGTIYVNINSRDPLMVTFGHEMFHDLVADSKYSGLIDTLVENPDYADMVKGMMNAKTELYERNGIELDPNAAAEEVAADISGDLLGSRDMLEYIGARNTEAATGIKGFLNRILKKLKGKPSAQEAYNRLSEAQKALLDGMEGKAETGVNGSESFSLIDVAPNGMEIYETSLTTQQLSESQKKKQYLALIKNQYRGRTARLERNGHVVYVRPDIQEAGKPIYGDRRSTANGAKALRNSLADGDVFDLLENAEYDRSSRDTKNHKNADYFDYYVKTVQIDGKVYDLVADVKRVYGNSDGLYYTLYLVDNATKKAVVSQRPQTLGSSEPITASEMGSNSFSADMVPQSDAAVNNYSMQNSAEDASGKHSLMDIPAMDSTGRELSAEQREYFLGSKVVDAEGRLKPVYHGSPAVFTEFSPDFMSQHGSSEGQGFYFTDYKPMAEGYQKDGGQLLEGYLDIKKPLSDSEITLTRAEVKKLLRAVDPTGDEVLVNYDPAGGIGYPSKAWYNRALDATVKAAMEYSSSDSEILAEIANGGAGTGAVLEAARNTLGYDGYIVEGKYDNATVYVAFDSSQFKNIDNTAPTESKDIRYSLMEDAQYMADIDRVVSEATEKANDELKAAQAEVKDIRQQLADYRQQATAEAKMNDRWRDAETKLLTEIAAAKEREKAAKARAEFMAKYDALSKQYRADLRANNRQVRDKYNEKLSEAKDEFNRRRTQDRIDRVVREDRAKSKARLRTAEQKSTTTEDVAKVLTEMPKKDKETFKEKAAESWRTFKRQWINTKDELERFGNEVGDSRIMYAANNVGQASAAAQYSIGGAGQYDLNGKKIGDKNLMQVFEPAKKAGLTDEFYTYLLHEHNVDRMSVREKAQRQLAELRAKLNREVNGFAEMTDENIATAAGKDTTLTKAYTEVQIAAAKQYKQFQAWAEKQFDKPVFGSSVTADDSRAAAADLLDAHPEFEKWAKDVYAYLDGLMEVRKQGGLVSADMAQYMKELYPHYVPTYRDMPSTSGGYSNPNSVAVNSTIKSAKGGNQDIMPLIDSIARQTLQTFSAAKKNILGNMLYEDAMDTTRDISEYIQSVTEEGDLVDLDADSVENLKNTLRIWVDGKPVTLHMSEAMADGFRPIEQSNSFGMKALRSINSTFKKLVTQWNPVFIVRNFVRDAQSALYFTHYSNATFIKNYGKAVKEIATNGKYWRLYQAMGGKGTTYYDPKTGLSDRHHFKNGAVDKVAGGLNRVIDILSFANEAVEQYPRLAEFISTMEDTGDVQQALYNAADITTNFGRGGFAARKLNASLVPFFNPGMQGLSKNIRNVIDRHGWKEIGQLISRLLINGVAPGIIMSLLYDGLKEDDDYKELSNYIKDSNILIKIGDNKFIKVPMGREPSVITAFTNRMWRWLKGEPASSAFAGYPSFAIEQIAPNNPLTNNIFAGITAMSTNKTWYGGDIVSSYMEEKPDYLQYDESTDAFSIWLGEITRHGKNGIEGLSPKKVNYLIDQYSGFIGDWVLPTFSKKADVPAVVKAFVVDSTRQNRLGSDFYEALDIAQKAKDSDRATASDKAVYGYLSDQKEAAAAITKQLRELYDRDMAFADYLDAGKAKEIREKANDLYKLRNDIYRNALEQVSVYEENAKGIKSADSKEVKRDADYKTFGAEYALKEMNKATYEKATEYVSRGVTYDQYYSAYLAARGITGDKGENGKTITNSASRKKKEAIDKAVPNATTKQKHLLYEALEVSEKVW